ncbi:MAG: hypothetical protein GM46_12810 [actinobacterium acAcidi]|nr:MAG: hypothetical protein GM46_12810 [actinobacterium acAcidi]
MAINPTVSRGSATTQIAPPVVAAVVVHEPGAWFAETLQALAQQDYPNLQTLFFVTSGSQTAEEIRKQLPDAIIRTVDGNPGYGPLMNEIGRLVEGDGGFFCLLHDDVALEPDAVSRLMEEMFRSNAGIVGPKLVMWDDPTIVQSVGFGVDRIGEVSSIADVGEKDQEQHDAVRDVFALHSACLLVRADLFREIGGFAPDIRFFGEDIDLCWRVHLSGARVVIVPAAKARHLNSFDSRTNEPSRVALEARHRVRTIATLSGRFQLPFVLVQLLIATLVQTVVSIFGGGLRASLIAMRAALAVVVDVPYIIRRRAQVRPYRRIAPREIHELQIRGSARLSSFIRKRRMRFTQNPLALERDGETSNTKGVVIGILATVALIVLGSRGLIASGIAPVGEFLPLRGATESPSALLSSYLSGWWQSGFGHAGANPTGIALLALAGIGFLGRLGALQTYSVIGALLMGCWGMWSVAAGFFSVRARAIGMATYAAAPLPYVAIEGGRWGVLLCYAALPWMIRMFVKVGARPSGAALTKLLAGAVLLTAVVTSFTPAFALVLIWLGVVWVISDAISRVAASSAIGVLRLVLVGVVGAFVLHSPWSGEFFVADWLDKVIGRHPDAAKQVGMLNLSRLDGGLWAIGVLVLGLYAPTFISIVVARAQMVVWSTRALMMVVLTGAVLVLNDSGTINLSLPETGLMLAIIACGLALGAATLANIMFDETAIRPNGLWRSLGALSLVAATIGMVPAITGVVDGRWGQPETTLSQLLTQLPTNPESGDYNVVFLGRSEVLPMAGKSINDAVAFAVSDDGELTLRDHWMPISSSLDESVSSAFSAVISDQTVRAGRLLAPLAIRYIVVPIVDGGASTVERPLPAPDGLLASLSAQLDFRRVYTANDLVIFENVAYIPSLAVIDENTSLVSEQAGSEVLLSSQLASVAPLARSGDVESVPSQIGVGTVHAAVPFDDGLALDIQGVKVKARVAFGGTSAFDLPIEGVARLTFDTPLLHFVLVTFQALLWAVVVIALFDLGRFKRRIASTRLGEIVFHEETEDQK